MQPATAASPGAPHASQSNPASSHAINIEARQQLSTSIAQSAQGIHPNNNSTQQQQQMSQQPLAHSLNSNSNPASAGLPSASSQRSTPASAAATQQSLVAPATQQTVAVAPQTAAAAPGAPQPNLAQQPPQSIQVKLQQQQQRSQQNLNPPLASVPEANSLNSASASASASGLSRSQRYSVNASTAQQQQTSSRDSAQHKPVDESAKAAAIAHEQASHARHKIMNQNASANELQALARVNETPWLRAKQVPSAPAVAIRIQPKIKVKDEDESESARGSASASGSKSISAQFRAAHAKIIQTALPAASCTFAIGATISWLNDVMVSSARPLVESDDGLQRNDIQLRHWVRHSLLVQHSDYRFARFNKQVKMLRYSDQEYATLLRDDTSLKDPKTKLHFGWSREETDLLMRLAQKYDLRFIVIQDRFNDQIKTLVDPNAKSTSQTSTNNTNAPASDNNDPQPATSYPERSVEQLKGRFYEIQRLLMLHRNSTDVQDMEKKSPFFTPAYNADHETERKRELTKLYARSVSHVKSIAELTLEHRKVQQLIKRLKGGSSALPGSSSSAMQRLTSSNSIGGRGDSHRSSLAGQSSAHLKRRSTLHNVAGGQQAQSVQSAGPAVPPPGFLINVGQAFTGQELPIPPQCVLTPEQVVGAPIQEASSASRVLLCSAECKAPLPIATSHPALHRAIQAELESPALRRHKEMISTTPCFVLYNKLRVEVAQLVSLQQHVQQRQALRDQLLHQIKPGMIQLLQPMPQPVQHPPYDQLQHVPSMESIQEGPEPKRRKQR